MLRWFSSYLTGRIQSGTIGNTTCSSRRSKFGVPQSSILGPLLFILYAAPIQDIISAHNLDGMFYADDSHDQRPALNTLQMYTSEVIEWNTIHKSVCSPSKTEFIRFSSRFVKNPILSDFLIGNASPTTIRPSLKSWCQPR